MACGRQVLSYRDVPHMETLHHTQGEFHSYAQAEGIIDIITADRAWIVQTVEVHSGSVVSCRTVFIVPFSDKGLKID